MFERCAVLLAVAAIASAGPIGSWDSTNTECASSCPYDSKFSWEPSKTYVYEFSGDVKTLIQGATEEHSSLHITAGVQIEVLTRCEMVLKLSNVDLQDSNPKAYETRESVPMKAMFKQSLEQNILRFGMKDGELESVCEHTGEEVWVLNIKRGILSHLQNTMSDLDRTTRVTETDVSGKCPVMYKPLGSGRIEKSKDVLGCVGGHGYETIFKGVPYESASRIQSLPLMKSSFECVQTVNADKIISQVSCIESHVFRPFAKEESGATTQVATSLRFIRVNNGIRSQQEPIRQRSSIAYDDTPSHHEMEVAMNEATGVLRSICDTMRDDVRPEVPALFGKLVKKMRHLDSQNLMNLHRQAKRMCDKAIKFYQDAVPMLHSTASLSLVLDLIRQNEISPAEAEIWLTSLSLIPRPTTELLEQAKPLIAVTGPLARKASLAVSSLVNSFCDNTENCESIPIVQQIIKIFEDSLNYNCNGDHERVLMGLKAIGNTGNAGRVVAILGRCMTNTELPMEVRVAAINAHRRMSCDIDRTQLKDLYTNMALDSELRINAYLQLMKCPTTDIISQVGHTLENEEINQVGSFVWTHLTNLMESSDPHKIDIADILAKEELKKAFDLDARKFSRNIEWSMFSHLINSGATVESNVIMSEKSFVPRSASVNITVDLFGRAINLFEVDGRLEGFDSLLEDLFGPKKEINDLVDGRYKRSADFNPDALNAFDNSYKVRSDSEPKASYSLKVFGNEIRYDDFHSISMDTLKENMNFLNWLISLAQDHQFELTKSVMFLDSTMVIPTATGMPLKLSAEGTATVNFKVNGKLDIRRMMTWPSHIDIDGSITPSGAVEITSDMGVDAHCAKTGLQMVSTLHSSKIVQGKVQLQDGKVFSFNLDMPKDKVELISVQSKFLINYREESREQRMLTDNVFTYNDCLDLNKPLGIEVCAEASIPRSNRADAPMFPFTGPMKASIVINKKDTHTGYTMEAKFVQEKARGQVTSDLLRFAMNTPGSQTDREIMTQLAINREEKSINYKLKTPWKVVNFDGSVTNTDVKKAFSSVATIDNNQEYSLTFDMPIVSQKNGLEYTPNLQISIPGVDPMKINGRLYNNPGRKVEYELRFRNVFRDPAKINGDIVMINKANKLRYQVNNEITSSFFTSTLSASIDYTRGKTMSNRIQLEYAFADGKKESFTISNKLKDQSTNTLTQYDFDSTWSTTLYPAYNGDMDLDFTFGRNTLTVNLDTGFGKNSRVKVTQSGNFDFSGPQNKADGFLKLELPRGKEYELTVKHNHNDEELNSMVNVKYAPNKEATFDAMLKRESSNPLKLNGEMKITYPGREIKIIESIEQTSTYEYKHNMDLQWANGKNILMESTLKLRPRWEVTTDLTIPSLQPIKLYGHLKPSLRSLESKGEINYGDHKYGIEGNWNHGGNINTFTSRGNFDLEYPGRKIVTTVDLSRRAAVINGEVSTKWDAGNDESKKFGLNFKSNIAIEKPSVWVKVEYFPRQSIEVAANAKYEPDSWMRSDSDLEGNISFKSTIEEYENVKLAFKYDHSPDSVTAHSEASYDQKKFAADLTMRKNEDYSDTGMALTITTPFETYQTMGMSADYALKGRNVEAGIKVNWDDKEIALTANGEANIKRHFVDGTMKLTSPFTAPATLTVQHIDNGRVFTTTIKSTWSRGKEMKLEQTLTHEAGSKLAADIKFTSPFTKFEEITLTSNTENQGSRYVTNHELKWSPSAMIKLDSSLTLTGILWDGNLRLTTPFRSFDRLFINTSNKKNGDVWESHVDIEATATQKIELDTVIGISTTKKVAFTFKCPPGELGTTEFSAEFSGRARKFNTGVEMFNDKLMREKISLRAELDALNMRNSKASIDYSSPIGLQFIKINLGNEKQGRTYTTEASLEYPQYKGTLKNEVTMADWTNFNTNTEIEYKPGQKIEAVVSLSSSGKIEGLFSLKSPFHLPIEFTVRHEGNLQSFTSNTELTYSGDKAITGTASFTMGRKIEGSATVTTPFNKWSNVNLKFAHEGKGTGISSSAEFSWSPRDKITGNVEFGVTSRETSGSVRITTPFEKVSRVNAEFTHKGQLKDFTNSGSFEVNTYKYTMENTFKVSGSDFEVSTVIATPIRGYQSISASYVHSGTMQRFTCDAELNIGNKKRTFDLSFASEPKIEVSFEVDGIDFACCQVIALNNIKGGFTHTHKNWRNFKSDGFVEIDGTRYNSEMEFKWFGKTFRLSTNAGNPNVDYGLSIRHKGALNNFDTTVSIDTGSDDITAKASFKNTPNKKTGSFELTTPHRNFRKAAIDFSHEGPLTGFTSTLNIEIPYRRVPSIKFTLTNRGGLTDFTATLNTEYNRKTVATTLVFKVEDRKAEGSLTVTTEHPGYERFATAFSLEASRRGYFVSANVETPFENFQKTGFEASHTGTLRRGMESKLIVETSVPGYDKWEAEVKYEPKGNGISASATVDTPIQGYSKFAASVNYDGTPSNFRAGASIETSVRQFRKLSAEITHEYSDQGFKSSVKIETPFTNFQTMSASASHQGYPSSFTSQFDVQTSYPGYETWKVELTNNYDEAGVRSKLSVTTPIENYNSFSAELTHRNTAEGFKTEFTITTSIPGFAQFKVELEHDNSHRGFTTKGIITTPIRGWQRFGLEVAHAIRGPMNFKSSVDISTPFRAFNKLSGELDHQGDLSSFQTTMNVKTPSRSYPEVSVSINHRGQLKDFTTTVNIGYAPNKNILTEVVFKTNGRLYEGKLKLDCPCPIIKSFEMIAEHDRTGSGKLDITYNDNKIIDMDYTYTKTTPFTARVEMNHPRPYAIELNFNQNGASYTGDVSIDLEGQRLKVDMDLKNQIENYNIERSFNIAVELPNGKYRKFSTDYMQTPNRLTHKMEAQWEKSDQSKATFELELASTRGGGVKSVDGQVKLSSPWINSESTINHVVAGNKYTTEVVIQSGQRIVLKNELELGLPTFKNEFTMQHPNLRQDLQLTVEGTLKYNWIEGKLNARVEGETLDIHGMIGTKRGRQAVEAKISHPTSNTDMDFVAELVNNAEKATANVELKWMVAQERQQSIYKLISEINKLSNELNIEFSCPNRELKLTGRKEVTDSRGIQSWSMVGSSDNKEIKAQIGWNKPEQTLDASIELAGDKIALVLNRESVKDWKVEVYHEVGGRRVQDVELSVVPARDGTVSGRTFFRPNTVKDLKEYLSAVNLESNGNCFTDLAALLKQDLKQKAQMFTQRTLPALKRTTNNVAGDQIQLIQRTYTKMYRNNDFKLRSMVNKMSNLRDWGVAKMQRMAARATDKMSFFKRKMDIKVEYWSEKINRKLNDLGNKIVQLREEYGPMIQDLSEVMDTIRTKAKQMMYQIKSHPLMQKLKSTAKKIENMDLLQPIHTMKVRMMAKIEELKEQYGVYFDLVSDLWSNVERKQQMRKVHRMVKKIQDSLNWAWEHYKVEEHVQKLAHEVSEISVDAIKDQALYEMKNRFQYDRNRVKTWDPESGNYEVEFYIPEDPFKDLQLPKLYLKENLMKLISWVREHMPESGINYLDIFYAYRPSSDYSDWVPPFKGHAALAGSQHFMTFDHKFYEFAGECSYLLARDFIDGKFSVVVSYDNVNGQTKKTITVHDGERKIDIVDGQVTVNGQSTEMPAILDHTTIRRMGSEIRVDNDHGVTVVCALHYDRCTLNVTGWYFGKTGGLFGTYDNEPATDYTTSDNRRAGDVEDFANSWTVGRRCRASNNARVVAVVPGTRRYELCAKYFMESDSPLRSCFGHKNPEAFMKMCMNDMGSNVNSIETEKDVCKTAAFYVDECKRHGIPLRVPVVCVSCMDPQGVEFTEGRTITLEENAVPKSADVVFVLQHASCNQEVVSKIAEITDKLNQALRAAGLRDNRFGIVGYGGEGILNLPYSQTLGGGQIMGEAGEVASVVGSMSMESGFGEGSALMALRYAVKYPFRTGVSKSVILVPCDSCREGKVRYHEIQRLFKDRDITLHMLMDHEFTLKGGQSKGAKSAYIFGADKEGLFTMKHIKGDLESDRELFNQVRLPKDICGALANEMGGTIFSTHHLLDSRRVNEKNFVEVMVRVHADRAQPTECQKCECVPGEDGVGVTVCTNCVQRSSFYGLMPEIFGPDLPASNNEQPPRPEELPERNNRPRPNPNDRNRDPNRRNPRRRRPDH